MKKVFFTTIAFILIIQISLFAKDKQITIIHTNDLHSRLLGFVPNLDYTPDIVGDDNTLGGWARIAAVIKQVREEKGDNLLVLDAGDFLMGTLFHTISREYGLELKLLKIMGFDAVALGNHEFDLRPEGFAFILDSGLRSTADFKLGIPALLASNVLFDDKNSSDDSLKAHFDRGTVKENMVLERNGLKIGLFGLMGKDAAEVAPFSYPVKFEDPIKTAIKNVEYLRNIKKVDIVICLSHGGLEKKNEDIKLAKSVKGIDIIISGHTHTKIVSPFIENNTIIVQAWEYGKQVGILDITYDNKKVKVANYKLIDINDTIKGDKYVSAIIKKYMGAVNMKVLKYYGVGFNSIIAHTDFDLNKASDESNLGNLITDGIIWYANKHVYDPKIPNSKVVVAIESGGQIREKISKGKTGFISMTDLFNVIPLGIGMEKDQKDENGKIVKVKKTIGYGLVSFYITAAEIKKVSEVLTSISPLKGGDYYTQLSGIKLKYNPYRMYFDRVTEISLGNMEEGYKKLDYSENNKKLYRVAANFYNSAFINMIGKFTFGALDIVPKDANGKRIKDLKDFIIDRDKEKEGIQELKNWVGLLEYVKSFKDIDGDKIPDIPERYKGKQGRIIIEASLNPYNLLKNGTYVTWLAFGFFILLTGLFILIGIIIKKLVKKIRA